MLVAMPSDKALTWLTSVFPPPPSPAEAATVIAAAVSLSCLVSSVWTIISAFWKYA